MASLVEVSHGPALIGVCLSLVIWGVNVQQFLFYFSIIRPRDHLLIPTFVGILFLLETLNSIFNGFWMYDSLITGFGNQEQLIQFKWSNAIHPVTMGVTICVVQLFFAWRIHVLLGKVWVVTIIVLAALVSAGAGIACSVLFAFVFSSMAEVNKVIPITICWYSIAILGDIAIASSLTWFLYSQRISTNAAPDSPLNKIMRLTIQNGLLTTIWAFTDLFVFLFVPGGLHYFFLFSLPKLYINAALSSLNARSGWNYGPASQFSSSGKHMPKRNAGVISLRPTDTQPAEVYVHVETHELQDVSSESGQWDATVKRHVPADRRSTDQSV